MFCVYLLSVLFVFVEGGILEGPTTVTRHELVPINYKRYNPHPQLSADYFLCRRGNEIHACKRNHRPSLDVPSTEPQPLVTITRKARPSPLKSKHCIPKKTCIHGTCLGSKCVCERGWRGRYCGRDLNECSKKRHMCSHHCKNTIGSYTCSCRRGFQLMADGQTCSTQLSHGNTSSVNTSSHGHVTRSHPQPRPAGLRAPGKRRPGVSSGSHHIKRQSQHAASRNPLLANLLREVRQATSAANAATNRFFAALGYNPGYYSSHRMGASPCLRAKCQHKCVLSTPTTAVCTCPSGFKLARNKRKCIDINECKLRIHNCESQRWCHNTRGGYKCQCTGGFILINDSRPRCEDVNECLTGQHMCGMDSICLNSPGSYRCRCKKGYHGDGISCSPRAQGLNSPAGNSTTAPTPKLSRKRPHVSTSIKLAATSIPSSTRRARVKSKWSRRPTSSLLEKNRRYRARVGLSGRYLSARTLRRSPLWRRMMARMKRHRLLSA